MLELIRRDPVHNSMRDLMNFISRDPFFTAGEGGEEGNLALDVSENENEVLVRASLPGFKKDQVDVNIHNGVLSIKAERTEEEETKNEKFYRRERRFGSVSRRIALPGVVSEAQANAEMTDGVLTIRIPKSEVARPKRISVK